MTKVKYEKVSKKLKKYSVSRTVASKIFAIGEICAPTPKIIQLLLKYSNVMAVLDFILLQVIND